MAMNQILRRFALIATITVVASAARARGYWQYSALDLTVKITAYFERGSESKLEGSGLFFQGPEGGYFILTSEHVVLPSKTSVVHTFQAEDGVTGEAEFVAASWERGLALLRVTSIKNFNHWPSDVPRIEDLGGTPTAALSLERLGTENVEAAGYPAGVTSLAHSPKGRLKDLWRAGSVLAGQEVYMATGLNTEFGMSGGPVFQGERGRDIVGIMTHVTDEAVRKTFIIPLPDAAEWLRNGVSKFQRTLPDIQAQYFSKTKSESVLHKGSQTKIEKRGDAFFLTAVGGFDMMNDLSSDSTLLSLRTEMNRRRIRVARIGANPELTLSQFVGRLMRKEGLNFFPLEDAESVQGTSNDPYQRDYAPHSGQEVSYKLKRGVETGNEFVELPILESNQSVIHTSTKWANSSQRQLQQEWMNRDEIPSVETWRTLQANCRSKNGNLEVVTVLAGTFKTCRIETATARIWYGPVPLTGVVKIEAKDGSSSKELSGVRY